METKKLTFEELSQRYQEAESCDSELFAEQRSNCLLVAGDHYNKKGSRFWSRIRDNKQLSSEQKIRLTKNHIQKICKTYVNNITSYAPGVAIAPKNAKELSDKKTAELYQAVWDDLKARHKLRKHVRAWAKDFIDIGECFVKVFFDPNKGKITHYEAATDENGEPIIEGVDPQTGQPQYKKGKPVYAGDILFERFFAFNVLRDPGAKSLDESPYLILRKMTPIADLKKMVGDDEDKLKLIQGSTKDTYIVFEGTTGEYKKSEHQALVLEHYIRPCPDYPNGYFFITTEHGILFEGELPFGVFPVKYCGFDEIPTSPRSRSIIKTLRPYQAEVNRTASKIAEHQVVLGDDKILVQAGTKLQPGGSLPGVRGVQYSGAAPVVLQGRTGEQYVPYMTGQIEEMYQVANVVEDSEERNQNADPFAMLWASVRNKKKFSMYAEKFEELLVEVTETALELAQHYYTEAHLIPAIGRREYINIAEFKKADKLCYLIKAEPRTEDIDSQMGKQLQINHVLQYVGNQLKPEDIGLILRSMPFMDQEQAFSQLTINYDNAQNLILALDRGEFPETRMYNDHEYMLKWLNHRQNLGDYELLPENVKANYEQKLKEHEGYLAFQQDKLMNAQSGYIPVDGYLVTCDFYVPDPSNPMKTRRVRLPYSSVDWLIKRLEEQGKPLEMLENMSLNVAAGIAGQMQGANNAAAGQVQPQGQGMSPMPAAPPSAQAGA